MSALRQAWLLLAAIVLALPTAARAQHAGHAATPAPQVKPEAKEEPPPTVDHSQMDHSKMDHSKMAPSVPREPIPEVSDADRVAAFPEVHAHHQHGTAVHSYWLLDRLEVTDGDEGRALGWEGTAWVGGDLRKLWLRSEGHAAHGEVESATLEVLYGQGVRAWWDVVAGVRQDFGAGPSRTWAAFGVQGLAPYKFEVSATVYLGQGGRTAGVVEAEYDTLLTNRWILQWRAEAEAHGQHDPALGIGSGLGSVEAGLRLRYEIHRQFAPYIGIERGRAFGNTADLRRAEGKPASDTTFVAGVRLWF